MAKKKVTKEVDEIEDDLDAISEESDSYYNATAYLPVYNEERKAYDMLLIRVDTINKKAFVETEKMKYDIEARALQDLMKRYSEDFIKKPKKKK